MQHAAVHQLATLRKRCRLLACKHLAYVPFVVNADSHVPESRARCKRNMHAVPPSRGMASPLPGVSGRKRHNLPPRPFCTLSPFAHSHEKQAHNGTASAGIARHAYSSSWKPAQRAYATTTSLQAMLLKRGLACLIISVSCPRATTLCVPKTSRASRVTKRAVDELSALPGCYRLDETFTFCVGLMWAA